MSPDAMTMELATLEQIEAYLKAHPTLLADHPALLETQRLPVSEEGNVVDLQHYLLRRLQQENALLKASYEELVRSCRDNLSSQVQVHDGILAILDTATLDELMEVMTVDLMRLFDVDVVRLCLEADVAPELDAILEEHPLHGITFIKAGEVQRLMGEQTVRLTAAPEPLSVLLHDCDKMVGSAALLRLQLEGIDRPGILAFGTRHPERYGPGQGTELLAFLASVVQLRLNACLSPAS